MSDTKIKVPDGMLDAVIDCHEYIPDRRVKRKELEVALLWQKNNAPEPTLEQWKELSRRWLSHPDVANISYVHFVSTEWIKMIYDEQEPEVPQEIADMLQEWSGRTSSSPMQRAILDAFRRGQKSKEK